MRLPNSIRSGPRRDRRGQASFSMAAVLLLTSCALTTTMLAHHGTWTCGGHDHPSLRVAESGIRDALCQALDEAMGRALVVAVREEGVDLSSALDAHLSSLIKERMPATAGGWTVSLEGTSGGLTAVGPGEGCGGTAGRWTAHARALVSLSHPGVASGPPVRLGVSATGPPGSPGSLASRVSSILGTVSDPRGPLAQTSRDHLWQVAQARALEGVREPDALLPPEEVGKLVGTVLSTEARGALLEPPAFPGLGLEELFRQAVEGALERNLLWLDDYLLLGDGLAGLVSLDGGLSPLLPMLAALDGLWRLEEALRTRAAEALVRVVVEVLEETSGELPGMGPCHDLEGAVERGVAMLEGLERGLASGAVRDALSLEVVLDLVSSVADGVSEELGRGAVATGTAALLDLMVRRDGPVVRHVQRVMADAAVVLARLGTACARDALLALGTLGAWGDMEGREEDCPCAPHRLTAELEDLAVRTAWTGSVACGPPGLLTAWLEDGREGRSPRARSPGGLPYLAWCKATITGTAVLRSSVIGTSGAPLRTEWREPVDLAVRVPVVTGWPLEGVVYGPSSTLAGDVARVAEAVFDTAWGSVGWTVDRFHDAAERVGGRVRQLREDMWQSVLSESAYTLSRTLWRIGGSLVDRKLNDAMNGTWDLLMDLFGDDLREVLSWELDLLGTRLRVTLDPASQRLDVRASRDRVDLNLSLVRLSDPHPPFRPRPVEGYHWAVLGEARLEMGGLRATVVLDPLTLEHPSVMTLVVGWGDGRDGGELVLEALEARRARASRGARLSQLADGAFLLSMTGGATVDAGLVLHGDAGDEGALEEMAERAVKDAWLATVRGWTVGDLLGSTGRGPDAGGFLETLLRELHFAMVDRGEDLVSELEAFVEAKVPSWPSVRVSLVLTRPLELVLPLQAWVAGALPGLVGSAAAGSAGDRGTSVGLEASLTEHVLVRAELAWGAAPPGWLDGAVAGEMPDQVGLVLRSEASLASLARLCGGGPGLWEARFEVLARGVPGAALALVPGMGSADWRWAEVTLARLTLREVASPRVLVSQVLYDASGRDADMEYVELLNAGDRMLDLEGFRLSDDGGSFVLRGHLPVLPGDHVLVARNSTAVRGRWGVPPDAGRMGLRLANDGDQVSVVSPDGQVLDMVAWEGYLPGWDCVRASEGEALLRLPGALEAFEPSAWSSGRPEPRRTGW